ncbi:MAG TPA: nitroreductase family deazaflavin-dependent oxidoreductase [Thermoanaerobaculia bacterium]|nr:nitroreductase family deazaflavin-dependent oxidoreductase [Thermoanaerobaculia bacterium]
MAAKPQKGTLQHELTRYVTGAHTALYRLTGGWVGGWIGVPILLLTTKGRKSGRPRTQPLLYLTTDRGYALVASYGGSDRHPDWYVNLVADPVVEVQVGPLRKKMRAHTTTPDRRAELWPRLVAIYPDYDVYQRRTAREIPVVELEAAVSS